MVPGYVLNHVHLANVNLVDRSKDNKSNLIFVQFSTDKFQPSPSMLYFGQKPLDELVNLKGSKVNVHLRSGGQSFTVDSLELVK